MMQAWCSFQSPFGNPTTRYPMGVSLSQGVAQAGQHGAGPSATVAMSWQQRPVLTEQSALQGWTFLGQGSAPHLTSPYAIGSCADIASENVFTLRTRLREQTEYLHN